MARILAKNIGFLTLSQAANYIFPLITIPYVTRIVGPDNYGLVEFGTVSMLYFSAVVIFGFNTTATRKIAANPEDMDQVSRIFSSVLQTRLLLFLATSVVFAICIWLVPFFQENLKMFLFAYPIVLGWTLYPDFLFQGVQKLRFVAQSNFFIKALAAALIFILIKEPEDFYLVLGINALAQVVVGAGLLLSSQRLIPGLRLIRISLSNTWEEIKEASYIFFSVFFTRLYVFGSILFLGFMLTEFETGIFASALKLVTVAQSFLLLPLTGALFPYLSNLYSSSLTSYLREHRKFQLIMIAVSAFSALILVLFPKYFILLVFGADFLPAVPYLRVMGPVLVATAISHFSLQQGLMVFHKDKQYLFIVVATGIISFVVNYLAIKAFGLAGAAWSKLGVEVGLAIISIVVFYQMRPTHGSQPD